MNDETAQKSAVIFLVDDHLQNLKALVAYLKERHFDIVVAQSGEETLERVNYIFPDLILLDVLMPGIDGFETCRRLKASEETRHIPIIFMTALSDTVDKIKGFEVGGVDFLTKPLHHEEVFVRVNTHLTLRRLQRQLEEKNRRLEEQNALLQHMNAEKDKFLGIIAHDLRSPFSALDNLLHITIEKFGEYTPEKVEQSLKILGRSSENLLTLIENLLIWSRIQRGLHTFDPQRLNLHDVICWTIDLLSSNAEQKQITVINEIHEALPVQADRNMIELVFRNLLSNAIKFTYPEGKITISAAEEKTMIQIAVQDTGIGIPEKSLPKLFRIDERYKQLGTMHEKGTGMGLILCKEFVEKHGGAIWIESVEDQGTTVKFTLPRAFL